MKYLPVGSEAEQTPSVNTPAVCPGVRLWAKDQVTQVLLPNQCTPKTIMVTWNKDTLKKQTPVHT